MVSTWWIYRARLAGVTSSHSGSGRCRCVQDLGHGSHIYCYVSRPNILVGLCWILSKQQSCTSCHARRISLPKGLWTTTNVDRRTLRAREFIWTTTWPSSTSPSALFSPTRGSLFEAICSGHGEPCIASNLVWCQDKMNLGSPPTSRHLCSSATWSLRVLGDNYKVGVGRGWNNNVAL